MNKDIVVTSSDREVAKRLAMMLTAEGYSAYILENLTDFETKLNPCKSHLLIVDYQPNCVKNTEYIEMIKSMATNPLHKCLILVSSEQVNALMGQINEDSIAYLQKPILHASFVKKVGAIVREQCSEPNH